MLAAQFDEALKFHRMRLSLALAGDLEDAEDHPATCEALGASVVLALDLRQTDIARHCVRQIAAIARRPGGATAAVATVAQHALRLQAALGEVAEEALVELAIAALLSEGDDQLDPLQIPIATQMAKGLRFGADLRTGPAAFEIDPVLEALERTSASPNKTSSPRSPRSEAYSAISARFSASTTWTLRPGGGQQPVEGPRVGLQAAAGEGKRPGGRLGVPGAARARHDDRQVADVERVPDGTSSGTSSKPRGSRGRRLTAPLCHQRPPGAG